MNNNKEDLIKQRKTYEINELLQTGQQKLLKLYLAIKNASDFAYQNCDIKMPLNYDVFNEIEKNAIKFEKKIMEEKINYYENIIKSISQTERIPDMQYIRDNFNSMKNNNEIEALFDKIAK